MYKKSAYTKVLGYKWNTQEDLLKVELQNLLKYDGKNNGITKREVLQMIGKMYDPIGILNLFTVTTTILMHKIWKAGLNWEDKLNGDMHNKWTTNEPLI